MQSGIDRGAEEQLTRKGVITHRDPAARSCWRWKDGAASFRSRVMWWNTEEALDADWRHCQAIDGALRALGIERMYNSRPESTTAITLLTFQVAVNPDCSPRILQARTYEPSEKLSFHLHPDYPGGCDARRSFSLGSARNDGNENDRKNS